MAVGVQNNWMSIVHKLVDFTDLLTLEEKNVLLLLLLVLLFSLLKEISALNYNNI
jgi:hypothetical protein